MSELQLMMGASALLVVVGVYGWSRWQEGRRSSPSRSAQGSVRDPLLESLTPAELLVNPLNEVKRKSGNVIRKKVEPPVPAMECEVMIEGPLTGEQWWQGLQSMGMAPTRVRWIGQVDAGQWVMVESHDDFPFGRIHALLQLVSRAGRVSVTQLETFVTDMGRLAALWGEGRVIAPDLVAVGQAAVQLDELSEQVDILVGVNVIFSTAKPPLASRLMEYLQQEGMALGEDGICHARGPLGADRFTLMRQDGAPFIPLTLDHDLITAVTLLLEVAHTDNPVQAFQDMFAMAERIALMLQGQVVDDQGERLGVGQCAAIEKQLSKVMGLMQTHQIPAGSSWAKRLFS